MQILQRHCDLLSQLEHCNIVQHYFLVVKQLEEGTTTDEFCNHIVTAVLVNGHSHIQNYVRVSQLIDYFDLLYEIFHSFLS